WAPRLQPGRTPPFRVRAGLPILRILSSGLWLSGSGVLVLLPKLRGLLSERGELPGGVGAGTGFVTSRLTRLGPHGSLREWPGGRRAEPRNHRSRGAWAPCLSVTGRGRQWSDCPS